MDGKQFALRGQRFHFRGVTYGTFAPRRGRRALPRARAGRSSTSPRCARPASPSCAPTRRRRTTSSSWPPTGTCTCSPALFFPDWRYSSAPPGGGDRPSCEAPGRSCATPAAAWPRREHVLGLCLGNEVPADVIRWLGTATIARTIDELAGVVRDEDPGQLVTYANYPTAEYLPLDEPRLPHVQRVPRAPARPSAATSPVSSTWPATGRSCSARSAATSGAHRAARQRQADRRSTGSSRPRSSGAWPARACSRGPTSGGSAAPGSTAGTSASPGPTGRRARRSPRRRAGTSAPSPTSTTDWPSMSVVVCAYNAAGDARRVPRATPARSTTRTSRSSSSTTGRPTTRPRSPARHADARLVTMPHGGLSTARNAGLRGRAGRDRGLPRQRRLSDRPSGRTTSPWRSTAPTSAAPAVRTCRRPTTRSAPSQVARAPGGPVHVLLTDDRAEHVPGCNMAFWRDVLIEVGGFDPVYDAAGDDVDLCWRMLEQGWDIGVPSRRPRVAPPPLRPAGLPAPAARLRAERGAGRGAPPRPVHGRGVGPLAGPHLRLVRAVVRAPAHLPRRVRHGGVPVRLPRRRARARRRCTRSVSRSPPSCS